jgi:superfamily II DNA or RNA helicase
MRGLFTVVDLLVEKKDEAFLKLIGDDHIIQELAEIFTFYVPGYQFQPKFKNKLWDGKIRLLDTRKCLLYYGLLPRVKSFCDRQNYSVLLQNDILPSQKFTEDEALKFIESLNIPLTVRDYQLASFIHAVNEKRMLLLSPTGSGKSLIIYLIIRYLQKIQKNPKILLIVPTVALTYQMFKDFEDYGFNSKDNCHIIHQGQEKLSDKLLYISTWQSLSNLDNKYFSKFTAFIGDEAHLFKAKSLINIATSCINADYRIGTTGTLDGTVTHRFVLEGLFGPVFKSTTTSKLIEKNQLSNFSIKCLVLKYPQEVCQAMKKLEYQKEMDFIVKHEARQRFVKNLVLSLKGNTLVLFQFVDKHGKPLYNMIKDSVKDRKVFFIHGEVDVTIREEVRAITEKETDAIIIASYGTFSTGINIKNLHNIISASPYKSKIKILQSIGRVLRLGDNKDSATLYDLADDFRVGGYDNHTLRHFMERIKIYNSEKFEYQFYPVSIPSE